MVRLSQLSLARPLGCLGLVLAVTIVLGAGLPRVRTEFGYRPLLGAEHPAIVRLEAFIERFGGGLPVRVVWRCEAAAPCSSALDPESLAMAAEIEAALIVRPEVRAVRSPASAHLLLPTQHGFAVRMLRERGEIVPDLDRLAALARRDPMWTGQILSEDGRTGALVIQPIDAESATSEALVDALFDALAPHQARGFRFHLVGHAVEFAVAGRELARSSAALTPITMLVVAGVLLMLTRSWQAVVASLGTLLVALVWTFGLLGWLGWPQDAVLQTLAPLVLVAGVCDAIHLLSRHAARCAGRPTDRAARRGALASAAASVARPCLLTSATTAVAFLSFASSDLETFVRFGAIAAWATAACLVLTFSLLPVLLLALPPEASRSSAVARAWNPVLDSVVDVAQKRHRLVLGVALALSLTSCVGWSLLRVDTDGYEMYGEASQVVRWIRFVESHLAPADTLEIGLSIPQGRVLEEPAILAGIEALARDLPKIEGLGRVSGLVDPMAWLHRILSGGDPAAQRIADTAPANAELLELLAFEDPGLLDTWVTFDRSQTRVSVEADFQSAAQRGVVLEAVRAQLAVDLPGIDFELTGPYAIGHDWVRDIHATQLRSFAIALLLVWSLVGIQMRSLRWASVALVPTLLPALGVLGAMGLLGLSLDVGRAMIAAILIGIGVDDTIHLLDRYRTLRRRGEPSDRAMRGAVLFSGRAVVTTSLALALGFLSLLASSWQTVSSFGLFVALGVLLAMVADLLVLPALVSWRGDR